MYTILVITLPVSNPLGFSPCCSEQNRGHFRLQSHVEADAAISSGCPGGRCDRPGLARLADSGPARTAED